MSINASSIKVPSVLILHILAFRALHTDTTSVGVSGKYFFHHDSTIPALSEQIFNTGCIWDAWAYISDLVRSAKHRVVLIDNFVDDRVLSLLDKRADHVEAQIHSRYYESFQTDLKKHNEQYREIDFLQLPHKNHDRFLIIDDDVYLLGASVKDMGISLRLTKV